MNQRVSAGAVFLLSVLVLLPLPGLVQGGQFEERDGSGSGSGSGDALDVDDADDGEGPKVIKKPTAEDIQACAGNPPSSFIDMGGSSSRRRRRRRRARRRRTPSPTQVPTAAPTPSPTPSTAPEPAPAPEPEPAGGGGGTKSCILYHRFDFAEPSSPSPKYDLVPKVKVDVLMVGLSDLFRYSGESVPACEPEYLGEPPVIEPWTYEKWMAAEAERTEWSKRQAECTGNLTERKLVQNNAWMMGYTNKKFCGNLPATGGVYYGNRRYSAKYLKEALTACPGPSSDLIKNPSLSTMCTGHWWRRVGTKTVTYTCPERHTEFKWLPDEMR